MPSKKQSNSRGRSPSKTSAPARKSASPTKSPSKKATPRESRSRSRSRARATKKMEEEAPPPLPNTRSVSCPPTSRSRSRSPAKKSAIPGNPKGNKNKDSPVKQLRFSSLDAGPASSSAKTPKTNREATPGRHAASEVEDLGASPVKSRKAGRKAAAATADADGVEKRKSKSNAGQAEGSVEQTWLIGRLLPSFLGGAAPVTPAKKGVGRPARVTRARAASLDGTPVLNRSFVGRWQDALNDVYGAVFGSGDADVKTPVREVVSERKRKRSVA